MKHSIIIIALLSISLFACSDNNDLVIVKSKSIECKNEGLYDIFLLDQSSPQNIIYSISCKENINDFSYVCLLKKSEHTFLVFTEYSSLAGLTKIHYLDVGEWKLFSTDFLQQEIVPLPITINIESGLINAINIDTGNYMQFPLRIEWERARSRKLEKRDIEIIQTLNWDK